LSKSLGKLHDEIKQRREDHDAKAARRAAERAAAHGSTAIDFAPYPDEAAESVYDVADAAALTDAIA